METELLLKELTEKEMVECIGGYWYTVIEDGVLKSIWVASIA